MAAKKAGRLDASSLEKALEDAFNDAPDDKHESGGGAGGGIDPNFAAKLHDKLEGEHDKLVQKVGGEIPNDEPSGLRAPATTRMLCAKELAALDDEEDVPFDDSHNHGKIDLVDSKLVTELNKKLEDEVAHVTHGPGADLHGSLQSALDKLGASEDLFDKLDTNKDGVITKTEFHDALKPGASGGASTGFGVDLSAALEKKLGGQAGRDDEDDYDNLDRRYSDIDNDEKANTSGLRAPQCTVKLSAQDMAGLDDDDDEVVDSALLVAQSHGGPIGLNDVDKNLVADLQRMLGAGGKDEKPVSEAGFRAPQNTVKLDASMLPDDEDDEDIPTIDTNPHGNIDAIDSGFASALQKKLEASEMEEQDLEVVERGCRAPQPTVKLSQDLLGNLENDEDFRDEAEDPMGTAAAAAAALTKMCNTTERTSILEQDRGGGDDEDVTQGEAACSGLRAPEGTKLITSDMLAGLDDDDDIEMEEDPAAAVFKEVQPVVDHSAGATVSSGSKSNDAKPKKGKSVVGFGNFDASFADSLNAKLGPGEPDTDQVFTVDDDIDDGPNRGKYMSGLSAPATTQQLTADQLANLDDEDDDIPMAADASLGLALSGLATSLDRERDDDEVQKSGMRAPACTQVMNADMLANIDDDDDYIAPMPVQPSNGGPSAEQLATLNAALVAVQGGTAGKQQQDPMDSMKALTMDGISASKVVDVARGLPEGPPRPLISSCKLRLAWLSKDEVSKENEQLRKEIASLRAEIDMHRKEATFARKV